MHKHNMEGGRRPTRSNLNIQDYDSFRRVSALFQKDEVVKEKPEHQITKERERSIRKEKEPSKKQAKHAKKHRKQIKEKIENLQNKIKDDQKELYHHSKTHKKRKTQMYSMKSKPENNKNSDQRSETQKQSQLNENKKQQQSQQKELNPKQVIDISQNDNEQNVNQDKIDQNSKKSQQGPQNQETIQKKEDGTEQKEPLQKRSLILKSEQQNDKKPQLVELPQREIKEVAEKKDKKNLNIIPVDKYFKDKAEYQVKSTSSITFSTMLVNVNIPKNINKFYLTQILNKKKDRSYYIVYTRYGRFGTDGYSQIWGPKTFEQCLKRHNLKVSDKLNKGYRVMERNLQEKILPIRKPLSARNQQPEIPSQLQIRVQKLITLIFDLKMMNDQLKSIKYDSAKLPLTNLTKNTILRAYQTLKIIMDEVRGQARADILKSNSSKFYSLIPHDFGWTKLQMYILDTEQKVRAKLQMLQSLLDIEVFSKICEQKQKHEMNPLDEKYFKLGISITPLENSNPSYSIIRKYVANTHGFTHKSFDLQIIDIYSLYSEREEMNFRSDLRNKYLLWHGSRLTNYVSILSQGLKIAPEQAPVTGYMFGKGVYFADMVSKAANYCYVKNNHQVGCLLLCQVALGQSNQQTFADYRANLLPIGKSSTKGVGKSAPASGQYIQDTFVPNGLPVPTGISNTSLQYNEYVVYDVNQIKCKYLLIVKFHFK